MPSRDANGKELGGAEKARRKRAKIEVLRRARMAERKRLGLPGLDFSDLPPPPYGEPLRVVGWCLDVLLVCADRVLRDEFMPFARKLRLLIDLIKRAGMLRDAAIEQRQILELLARQNTTPRPRNQESADACAARPPRRDGNTCGPMP